MSFTAGVMLSCWRLDGVTRAGSGRCIESRRSKEGVVVTMAVVGRQREEEHAMSSRRHDKSGRGEEEVAAMTEAAMSLRGLWAADDVTRSDDGAADDVTRACGNYGGK